MSLRIVNVMSALKILGAVLMYASADGAQARVIVEHSYRLTRETVVLPSGSFSSYEYELSTGTELIFFLRTAHWRREPLRIWLLDAANYGRMARGEHFDFLRSGTGMVDREVRISFAVPESGVFYFVLDNSESDSDREADVHAYVRTNDASNADERATILYQGFYDRLSSLIDIDGTEIHVRRCGEATAFTINRVIVICRELDELLDASAPRGVALFIFLHEISHAVIARWGYRSMYTNQLMVDRLAATLFSLMDEEGLAEPAAQWFTNAPAMLREPLAFDTFFLTGSRSRRIASWLIDEQRAWNNWTRRIVVPRMSTKALESFVEADRSQDRTHKRMQQELTERNAEIRR